MSGKDGDAKLSTYEGEPTRKKGNSWPLWVGGALTIGFAVLIFILLRARLPEWFPIDLHSLPAGEEPPQLTLSEIGNVLAGIFAPLAFLWLFVATMLQRQELELQREELQETREVLRKTAEANDAQADLMRGSLEIAQKSNEYEYFSLLLYYAAAKWSKLNGEIVIPSDDDGDVYSVIGSYDKLFPQLEKTDSVDHALNVLNKVFSKGETKLQIKTSDIELRHIEVMFLEFGNLISQFQYIVDMKRNSKNQAVIFRSNIIDVEGIYLRMCKIYNISRSITISKFSAIDIRPLRDFQGATP